MRKSVKAKTLDWKLYRAMLKASNEYVDAIKARKDIPTEWKRDLVCFGLGLSMSLIAKEFAKQDPMFQAKLAKVLLCDLIPDAKDAE